MAAMLDEAMEAGAIGLSTGLAYPTAIAAPTDEVVALTEQAAKHGGLYATICATRRTTSRSRSTRRSTSANGPGHAWSFRTTRRAGE